MSLTGFNEVYVKAFLGEATFASAIASAATGSHQFYSIDISEFDGSLKLKSAYVTTKDAFSSPAASADGFDITVTRIDSTGSNLLLNARFSAASAGSFVALPSSTITDIVTIALDNTATTPIVVDTRLIVRTDQLDANEAGPAGAILHMHFEPGSPA